MNRSVAAIVVRLCGKVLDLKALYKNKIKVAIPPKIIG